MDNLTHALAGALVCDALPFTKRLGPKAPLVAAIVAAVPDLDMVPAFIARFPDNFPPAVFSFHALFDREWVVRLHRGVSHSLFLYALVFIPLAYWGWRWSRRTGALREWAVLALICLLSHTFLDLNNRYGIRPWLPFSDSRYALGIFSLFDIPLLGILGAVFVLNHVLRSRYRERLRTVVGMIGVGLVAGRMLWALYFS